MKDGLKIYRESINKEELENYYQHHIPKECMEKFQISTIYLLNKLLDEFGISKRSKSDIIKYMHQNMSEETKQNRHQKQSKFQSQRIKSEGERYKISVGNKGKSKSTKGRISPLKGKNKFNNEALKRLSEERAGKSIWTEKSWNKRIETLKKNGTFNTSKREEELYQELILKYGKDDIERNYNKDPRYPFQCDFYIKSEDLFIELNYSWTHGDHPFDPNNLKDIEILNKWKEKAKNSKYYKIAIKVWTERDPLKIQIAKENNLKYILYYK